MKKLLSVFLVIALISCNSQETNSTENTATTGSEKASSDAGCGSLILFKKGTVVENTSYDAAGNETSKQTTTVNDVQDDGGILVANSSSVVSLPTGDKTINMIYKCDGKNIIMDMSSMLQNFDELAILKGDVKPVLFPLNIAVGQTLPEASYTISIDRGPVKMDVTATHKDRTVSAKENITTTAGSWDCYKVSSDIESDVQGLDAQTKKIMDAVKDKTKMSMIMWYHPTAGVVRTDMYMGGKLNSRSDITSIK